MGYVTSGMYLHENRTAFLQRNGFYSSYKGLQPGEASIRVLKVKLAYVFAHRTASFQSQIRNLGAIWACSGLFGAMFWSVLGENIFLGSHFCHLGPDFPQKYPKNPN